MTIADKQRQLIEDFALIENRHERLAAVVDRTRSLPALPEAARIEDNRVQGCVSRVWLIAELVEGRLRFRSDADSPVVKGLVALLCAIYDDATPADIVATEPSVLEELDLLRDLSPTRRNGLAATRQRIKALAVSFLSA